MYTKKIISKLSSLSDASIPTKNAKDEQMYQTLRDTFDAFDKDGSAELGYPEYVEAWRFLNRPGTDADIKRSFDSVDIDASGFLEWNEFSFSLMGEKALNFGALADLELLNIILKDTAHHKIRQGTKICI
jgi:Ca2+-binding EF-hand superfamily protein